MRLRSGVLRAGGEGEGEARDAFGAVEVARVVQNERGLAGEPGPGG